MILKQKRERLKDVLIDHIYDFCFNEVIQRVEEDGLTLTYDSPAHLENPEINLLVERIKKSGKFKGYYTTRESKYCQIITEPNFIHSSLINKLKHSGFSKGKDLLKNVHEAQDFLIARSYLINNAPIKTQVKLTEKGIKHYLDGKSFEDNYINRRNSNIAILISIFSTLIALIAIFTSYKP